MPVYCLLLLCVVTHAGAKVIRPSKLPWASPVLLAAKKGGKVRFCIDYRCLNDVMKKDLYPIPRIDDILPQLGGATHFSTMDLTDAFWSIPVAEKISQRLHSSPNMDCGSGCQCHLV